MATQAGGGEGPIIPKRQMIYTGEKLTLKHPLRDVLSSSIAPKQTLLATGLQNGRISLWETTTGQSLMTLEGAHKGPVTGVSFNQDASLLASCGDDCNLVLWDLTRLDNQQVKHRFLPGHGPNTPLMACAFSPDSLLLVSAGKDGDLMVWGQLGRPVAGRLVSHTSWVTCCAWSPTNTHMVSGSFDHSVVLWEMKTFKAVRSIRHHQVPVTAVAMSIEGTVIASGDNDGIIYLCHMDGTVLRDLRGHREGVTGISFAEIHGLLISSSQDWSVKFWSLRGHCIRSVGVHKGHALSLSVNEAQDVLVTTGDDFTAAILPFAWKEEGLRPEGEDDEDDGDPSMHQNMNFLEKNSQSDRGTRVSDRQSAVGADRKSAVSSAHGMDKKSSVSASSK